MGQAPQTLTDPIAHPERPGVLGVFLPVAVMNRMQGLPAWFPLKMAENRVIVERGVVVWCSAPNEHPFIGREYDDQTREFLEFHEFDVDRRHEVLYLDEPRGYAYFYL